jgi:hypothetical protein
MKPISLVLAVIAPIRPLSTGRMQPRAPCSAIDQDLRVPVTIIVSVPSKKRTDAAPLPAFRDMAHVAGSGFGEITIGRSPDDLIRWHIAASKSRSRHTPLCLAILMAAG